MGLKEHGASVDAARPYAPRHAVPPVQSVRPREAASGLRPVAVAAKGVGGALAVVFLLVFPISGAAGSDGAAGGPDRGPGHAVDGTLPRPGSSIGLPGDECIVASAGSAIAARP